MKVVEINLSEIITASLPGVLAAACLLIALAMLDHGVSQSGIIASVLLGILALAAAIVPQKNTVQGTYPLKKGYEKLIDLTKKQIKRDKTLRIYIHELQEIETLPEELKYINEVLVLVCDKIIAVQHKPEEERAELIKLYAYYTQPTNSFEILRTKELKILDFMKNRYQDVIKTSTGETIDGDKALAAIRPYVKPMRATIGGGVEGTVALVDEDTATLFLRTKDKKIRITSIYDAFASLLVKRGFDSVLEERYYKDVDFLVENMLISIEDRKPIAYQLENPEVQELFAKSDAANYRILAINAYCTLQLDSEGKSNGIGSLLEAKNEKVDSFKVQTYILNQESLDLQKWVIGSTYPSNEYKDHYRLTKQFLAEREEKGFEPPRFYNHTPLCRLIFIGKDTVLVSPYDKFNYNKKKFDLPIYKITKGGDTVLFADLEYYFDLLTSNTTTIDQSERH